jgi:ferric-dicitrate binding protein FerR (iron transport regulator)
MSDLESMMRDVARTVQGDARRRNLLPEIQARLERLDVQNQQARRAHGTWRLTLAGAALCAAGIAIFVLRPNALSYAVDGAGAGSTGSTRRTGVIGERLAASDSAPLALRFSDGSQVTLPPRAQAHVDELGAHGATVALEGGTVEVSVVHRARTRWEIRAGRYHIRVTGTRFAAGWDRSTDSLTVTMHEGSVEVTGPGLKAPARVVTGQRLRANDVTAGDQAATPTVVVEDATLAANAAAPVEAEAAAPVEAPEAKVQEAAAPEPEVATGKPVAAVPVRRAADHTRRPVVAPSKLALADAEWRLLEARGRFKPALAAAVRDGFDDGCLRLPAEDVAKLGETARLAGDFKRAEYAYQAVNRRFPSTTPHQALFGLGKIAFDQHRDYASAAKWFGLYVQRFPDGPLVREAAGLLLVSRIKAGDNVGARAAADRYLDIFPTGPHAKLARDTRGH